MRKGKAKTLMNSGDVPNKRISLTAKISKRPRELRRSVVNENVSGKRNVEQPWVKTEIRMRKKKRSLHPLAMAVNLSVDQKLKMAA